MEQACPSMLLAGDRTPHVLSHHRELACAPPDQRDDHRQFNREHAHQRWPFQSELDDTCYEIGKKIDDEVMKLLAITRCEFHGEWNYSVAPRMVLS
jgi:hypothetical protein